MPYVVKKKFGAYAVQDASGEDVKTFTGAGAKLAAEEHADRLNSGDVESDTTSGRGGYGRGGRGRGG